MAIRLSFYKTELGAEPVRKWLKEMNASERSQIGEDLRLVEMGWPVGKPLVDSLGHGLWEVRSRLNDKIARVIFYIESGEMVLLHGFIKKTQKTPDHEIDVAKLRMKLCQKKD